MKPEEFEKMVLDVVTKNAHLFSRSSSSVEIGKTSTGKPSFSVKVYGINPVENANRARILERQLSMDYFGESRECEPIPEPTDAELNLNRQPQSPVQRREEQPVDAEYSDVEVPPPDGNDFD